MSCIRDLNIPARRLFRKTTQRLLRCVVLLLLDARLARGAPVQRIHVDLPALYVVAQHLIDQA